MVAEASNDGESKRELSKISAMVKTGALRYPRMKLFEHNKNSPEQREINVDLLIRPTDPVSGFIPSPESLQEQAISK